MRFRIVCCGPRLVGYGPFDSVDAANIYASKYLRDYRTQVIPYEPPQVFDGEEGTYSDVKCSRCPQGGSNAKP